jgi:hypothetical protein
LQWGLALLLAVGGLGLPAAPALLV